ncbi:MAG: hypothetical protein Ct9H300mP2_2360 [Candidatus Neomarinimicrobiota bacterium]|nr:MAG: hypothetical protein Ct9H300mP2_2360 [Candidatus Neomarinimicrobiota bacterium]
METLFDGKRFRDISVSQTINGPAIILLAFYIAVAEKQGVPLDRLRGTLQNDILKEFIAQKEWIFPQNPLCALLPICFLIAQQICLTIIRYLLADTISEKRGSTAAQELAFTLANGFTYVEYGIKGRT